MHYQEPWTDAEMDKVELQVIDRLKDHLSIETIEGTVLYDWENVSREEHLTWCLEADLEEGVSWANE